MLLPLLLSSSNYSFTHLVSIMVVPIDNAIIDKIANDHLEEATEVSEKIDSLDFVEGTKEENPSCEKLTCG